VEDQSAPALRGKRDDRPLWVVPTAQEG
jgi:hypothetical protein